MNLHLLYTGLPYGGAQEIALQLASLTDTTTSTIKKGEIEKYFLSNNLPYHQVDNLPNKFWKNIILSDPRVLIYFVLNKKKFKANKVFFIPHSNKVTNISKLIYIICSILNIEILPTTQKLAEAFNTNHWYLPIPEQRLKIFNGNVKDRCKRLLYFGRFSKEKRLIALVNNFKRSSLPNKGYVLRMIGTGTVNLKDYAGEDVEVEQTWLEKKDLQKVICQSSHVINYSKTEGASLMLIEGILGGCIPLAYSGDLISNYNIDKNNLIRSPEDFDRIPHLSNNTNQIIESLNSQMNLLTYLENL